MPGVRIDHFFHPASNTFTYVVAEGRNEAGGDHCVIIDSALDYDPKSGRTATVAADEVAAHVRDNGLVVDWILETHPHADHLTAAPYLKAQLGGKIGIGQGVRQVQENFKAVFNLGDEFATDGSQFDHLFEEGERFSFGDASGEVWSTPGHTPACVCYLIEDAVFVGDTIFMPDFGSARCDFPDGDARTLFHSVKRLLALPPETRLFMCHDYGPGGREFRWLTSVGEQRADNKHMNDGVDEEEFVAMRTARDNELEMPVLLLPAVQVNVRGGAFPPPEENGVSYLKMPLNAV
ncbi:MAG: MBL fold metallo-hydrolase [Alphaproteobacteria bacterium]|jgi:glyoxylase-like metal-dependent hydrolase (beta-lactamase superfamily II)|nr:MBL fold metallo-hydrolase [Alphaproteobacteria bacterium]MDP6832110.1 MBL fold metallo-hydrolase [Alphaproteobacteria bacterium]